MVSVHDDDRLEVGREHDAPRVYPRTDPRAEDERAALVERHLGLARHLARRYADRGEPLDDLFQVASIGLLKAIDRFDPERGVAFSTYAVPTILGELRRHFRDRGWAIHVPRDLKDAALRVDHAIAAHPGRAPTPADLARETGMTVEQVLEAMEAAGAHRTVSLDMPARNDAEPPSAIVDALGREDDEIARAQDRVTLEQLSGALDEREREILRLRFAEDLTQSEIGVRVGVSQMQVSRLLRTALSRMRTEADDQPPP